MNRVASAAKGASNGSPAACANTGGTELNPIGRNSAEKEDCAESFSHFLPIDARGTVSMAVLRPVGWECAYALIQDHADKLTPQHHILCQIAQFSGPERCRQPGELLALYLHIAGVRP